MDRQRKGSDMPKGRTEGRTEENAVAALEEVLPGARPLEAVVDTDVRPVPLADARDVADHPVRVQIAARHPHITATNHQSVYAVSGRRERRAHNVVSTGIVIVASSGSFTMLNIGMSGWYSGCRTSRPVSHARVPS